MVLWIKENVYANCYLALPFQGSFKIKRTRGLLKIKLSTSFFLAFCTEKKNRRRNEIIL